MRDENLFDSKNVQYEYSETYEIMDVDFEKNTYTLKKDSLAKLIHFIAMFKDAVASFDDLK